MERVCPECGEKTTELTCPIDGEMTLVVKQETQADTMVGKVIGGRYRITKMVGQGGFGGVYAAEHTATGDTLAIKVLRADVENNNDVIMRFRQEAKQTSKLKHPNTVRVFDFGQMDDGNLFLAMEFLVGTPLTDVMRDEGPLDYKRVVKVCIQVLKSLSEAHSKGLVHRDLKPDNIFLQEIHGEPDFVRVLDFGIAKSLSDEQQDITSTGAVIGTPKYMSPEQARGQQVDPRTDIYSLGVILFECLSGTPPFVAETPLAMILRRVTEEPPRIHDNVALPTPTALCDVTLRSLARNPDDRYQTADEFIKALNGALEKTGAPLVQPRGAGGQVAAGPGGTTAAYGAGAMGADAGDETAAFDADDVNMTADVQVNVSGTYDDATVAASAEDIAKLASQEDVTINTAAPTTAPPGAVATVVAQLPPSVANAGMTGEMAAVAAGTISQTAIPMQSMPPQQSRGMAPWKVFAMGAVAVIAGFALFGLVSKQSVNAPANSGGTKAGAVQPAAVASAQSPQPKPAPAPAPPTAAPPPAPPPAAPAKPTTGKLKLEKTPSDAEVFVDGQQKVGSIIVLSAGEHSVVFKMNGYKNQEKILTVVGGETQTLAVTLEKLPKARARPRPRPRPRPSGSSGGSAKPRPKPRPRPSPPPSSTGLLID